MTDIFENPMGLDGFEFVGSRMSTAPAVPVV
jgi:hypothetical protein